MKKKKWATHFQRKSPKSHIDYLGIPLPEVPVEFVSEMFNRQIARASERESFDSIEAANAYLAEKIVNRPLAEVMEEGPSSPEDRAQVYAFAALAAESAEEIITMVQAALYHDPQCLDALVMETSIKNRSLEGVLADLRQLAADAEQRMGAKFIDETRGHFWGDPFTRPYMRLLHQIVSLNLRHFSQIEAIEVMEKMLDLNPSDNQGMRDTLLPTYLKNGFLEKALGLLAKYSESLTIPMYCKVLALYLSGDTTLAKKALEEARDRNPHVISYLLGKVEFDPEALPGRFRIGDESEARLCAFEILSAWQTYPNAIQWLREQDSGVAPRKNRKPRPK